MRVQLLLLMLSVQCSLLHGMLDKDRNKQLVENFTQWKTCNITGHKSWNKDYSKCAWVHYDIDSPDEKKLQLTLVGLANKDKNTVTSSSFVWQGFRFPVFEDDICPFFDKDERACFYGYGESGSCDLMKYFTVEYSIDLDGKEERYRCQCVMPHKAFTLHYPTPFFNFPVLLKALLQSTSVEIKKEDADSLKLYHTQGVMLPEDYKTFKQHIGLQQFEKSMKSSAYSTNDSYEDLSECIKTALNKKYEEQQLEKVKHLEQHVEKIECKEQPLDKRESRCIIC